MVVLLGLVSASGAQPNGEPLPGNARYLLPAAEAWTTALPAPAIAAAAMGPAHLYIPLEDGRVVALARETGAVAWARAVRAAGTPLPAGDLLLVPTLDGLTALETVSGVPRWAQPLDAAPVGPLVTGLDGLVAGASAGGSLSAVDAATGALAWTRELGVLASQTLATSGDRLFAALADGRVVAIAAADGHLVWERQLPGPLTAPAADAGRVVVGSATNEFFGLDAPSGAVAWRWRTGGDVVGSVVGAGRVYVAALDNRLRAVADGSGNQRWQLPLATRPAYPPGLVGTTVLVSGVAPEIVALDGRDGTALGTYTAPAELRGPVLADPAPRPGTVALAVLTRTNLAIGLRPTGLQMTEPPLVPLADLPGRTLRP